jgi:hypothetical protein
MLDERLDGFKPPLDEPPERLKLPLQAAEVGLETVDVMLHLSVHHG